MTIQVTGKNVDAGDAYQAYASDKIRAVMQKYIGKEVDSHVRLSKERGLFRTTCAVHMSNGLQLEAHGDGGDAYASADAAVHRLETRVRRYRERIKSHAPNGRRQTPDINARDYVLNVPEDDAQHHDDVHPLIVAEMPRNISELTVSEAVMKLDLSEAPFLIFKNAAHGELNIVYRRADGNIGWVDAAAQPNGAGSGNEMQKSR